MKNLLSKEIRLAASPLSYVFLVASLMTLLPGYPILMSAFFICFGVFHSFQHAREANDTLYTVLLPVRKRDFVRAKYAFTCMIQLIGFILCASLTAVRMTVLSTAQPYVANALMNATPHSTFCSSEAFSGQGTRSACRSWRSGSPAWCSSRRRRSCPTFRDWSSSTSLPERGWVCSPAS